MNQWPPLNSNDSGKNSNGQPSSWLKFLLFIPKPSPFVSSTAKKNSPLEIFPLILAQICLRCTKRWYSYSELTRRRNENKRSLKAMNHVCHHQRRGWYASLLGSHKPLGMMEEVRADLYTHKWAYSTGNAADLHMHQNIHNPHVWSFKKNPSAFFL